MSTPEGLEREKRLTRIRRLSNVMKWFVTALLILVSIVGALLVLLLLLPTLLDVSTGMLDLAGKERRLGDIPFAQRLGLVAMVLFAFFLLRRILWNIRQLFAQFEDGAFFAPATQAHVLNAGFWLLAYGVFDILSDPISSVLLTWDNAPGKRSLEIALNGGEFFFLVFGALLLVFGWIMREAAALANENRQFV
ncbi:hypothetical protein [Labrenzia sp. OB1]|uniref:hypothetical protein n=1 Tax=Labrenzia sp. OB1 TaxID=1561204 RepID=UPI0007B1D268|nr:hypothetical protein [Labrenzia sp. OB1]KZM49247.1 hypothetical protein OA90_15975 [Labrenzia sp. OB1]